MIRCVVRRALAATLVALWLAMGASAGDPESTAALELAPVLSDGMVMQQGVSFPVWGRAEPSAHVIVRFGERSQQTTADGEGRWRVVLGPETASASARNLVILAGDEERVIRNVLVGEVWLVAGQSNMKWPLESSLEPEAAVTAAAGLPGLRFFAPRSARRMGRLAWPLLQLRSLSPERYFEFGAWSFGSRRAAETFSAVGVYFGLKLAKALGVPVGLIEVTEGTAPAEAWLPRDVVLADPQLLALEAGFPDDPRSHAYVRKLARLHLAEWNAAERPGETPEHPYRPGFLFAAGVAPLAEFPIAGVIWYQGESNAHERALHDRIFRQLVASWRSHFGRSDLPIFWVQLPAYRRSSWPGFREGQAALTAIPNTGMAVTIDVGNPFLVHPLRKRPVGERLARLALRRVYGHDVADGGPIFRALRRRAGALELEFDSVGRPRLLEHPSGVSGFFVAGSDRRFARAQARLEGGRAVVASDAVSRPVAVRYAWEPAPAATLFGADGLPAAPFRSDAWPTIRVACVGDDLSADVESAFSVLEGYPSLLGSRLGPLFEVRGYSSPAASVVAGVLFDEAGRDRAFATRWIHQHALAYAPDIVIFGLGRADLENASFDADSFVREYVALIDSYRGLPRTPEIFVWSPLPPLVGADREHDDPRLAELDRALRRVVEQTGARLVALAAPLRAHGERVPDRARPDVRGAEIIADVVLRALEASGQPVAYRD